MNWQLLTPLLVTTVVAVVGWLVGHTLTSRRDRQNKCREIRVQYLIEAYRRLEAGSCRGPIHNKEFGKPFESAIADIQLLGTAGQSNLARTLANEIATNLDGANANSLLNLLRKDLRRELGQKPVSGDPFIFRFEKKIGDSHS